MQQTAQPTDACYYLPAQDWSADFAAPMQTSASQALEKGQILVFPHLPFALSPDEQSCLDPACVGSAKSVKYALAKNAVWGIAEGDAAKAAFWKTTLAALLQRYAHASRALVTALLPAYADQLVTGNTSFRPVGAEGRIQSKNHDDRLLHVDAFPSRPMQGQRILRVFTNIHPGSLPRRWQVGEAFPQVAERFMPAIAPPVPGSATLMHLLGITKQKRTPYDHYMLQLHNRMKRDDAYQQQVAKTDVSFTPGSTWIVFTDQVSHAALSGQHALEQTFTLPPSALYNPTTSPLHILETITGKTLT